MSWRIVVISKRAKLDYQLGYLVVRNEEVTKIHLSADKKENKSDFLR